MSADHAALTGHLAEDGPVGPRSAHDREVARAADGGHGMRHAQGLLSAGGVPQDDDGPLPAGEVVSIQLDRPLTPRAAADAG